MFNAYSVAFGSSASKDRLIVHNDDVIEGEKPMGPEFCGVMAAPNRCEIKAKVLRMEQSTKFPDKWYFELEILETRDLSGPNFARVGQRARGFTFESTSNNSRDSIITAQAEFLGDERGGQFQLTQIDVINPK